MLTRVTKSTPLDSVGLSKLKRHLRNTGELARHSPASFRRRGNQAKGSVGANEVLAEADKTSTACVFSPPPPPPMGVVLKMHANQKCYPGCWEMQVQGSPQPQS